MDAKHRLSRGLVPCVVALLVAGCGSTVVAPGDGQGGSAGGGAMSGGGATSGGGAAYACGASADATLLTGLAEGDSDGTRPGAPAVASDGARFFVVSPQIIPGYHSSAVVGALVTKDLAVENQITVMEGLPDPIQVDVGFSGTSYLVVFEAPLWGLHGVVVSTEGAPMGKFFKIADDAWVDQTDVLPPAVAFGGGDYLVAYTKFTSKYGNSESHLFARLVAPGGAVGPEILVSDVPGGQSAPAVAFDGTQFVVVWQDGRNKVDWDDTDIYAARVALDGTVLDPAGIPISTAPGGQKTPHVAFDGARDVVVWFDATDPNVGGVGNIRGARLAIDGSLIDGPPGAGGFAIDTGPNTKQRPRALAWGSGTLVVWGANSGAGISGARLGADGAPIAAGILLGPPPEEDAFAVHPTAAVAGNRALLVWLDNRELSGSSKSVRGTTVCPF